MAIQNENRENVTADVISKMLAIEGRSMSASQLTRFNKITLKLSQALQQMNE